MTGPIVQLSDAHLAALCAAVTRLLDGGMPAPTRLRVSLDGAAVELEWHRGEPEWRGGEARLARPPIESAPRRAEAPSGEQSHNGEERSGFHICAPMIGTFYRAEQPGADPFVTVGDVVSPGQQVGVLEAMKLFTPVEADRAGRVVEVLVADGTAVEYGQRLIELDQPDQ